MRNRGSLAAPRVVFARNRMEPVFWQIWIFFILPDVALPQTPYFFFPLDKKNRSKGKSGKN